jgi:integrase
LRKAQWPEIDFDKAEWRVPAERMKMGEQHIVPVIYWILKMSDNLLLGRIAHSG